MKAAPGSQLLLKGRVWTPSGCNGPPGKECSPIHTLKPGWASPHENHTAIGMFCASGSRAVSRDRAYSFGSRRLPLPLPQERVHGFSESLKVGPHCLKGLEPHPILPLDLHASHALSAPATPWFSPRLPCPGPLGLPSSLWRGQQLPLPAHSSRLCQKVCSLRRVQACLSHHCIHPQSLAEQLTNSHWVDGRVELCTDGRTDRQMENSISRPMGSCWRML